MYNINTGQVCVAQMLWKCLWGNACVSESCMTDIICAMGSLGQLWCQAGVGKGALEFCHTHNSYLFSPHQGSPLTFFLLIHIIVPLSSFWVYLTGNPVWKKEKQTTGSFFAQPFQVLLFFSTYLYTNVTAWPSMLLKFRSGQITFAFQFCLLSWLRLHEEPPCSHRRGFTCGMSSQEHTQQNQGTQQENPVVWGCQPAFAKRRFRGFRQTSRSFMLFQAIILNILTIIHD